MRRFSGCKRRGFTLIELLVVIAIIAALMALTASAVLKYMVVQQVNNTQTTLNKVQSVLNRQWAAAKDQAWKEAIPSGTGGIQSQIMPSLTGTDANATARMRVIYVKLRMRQMFPMNFSEALNTTSPPSPLPALQSYVTYLSELGISGTLGKPYESSVCLLMALQRAQGGGGANSLDLGGGGSTTSFTLPNGKGITGLADAWGQPIYFTRVPAGYTPLNPGYPSGQTGINDPGDPQGYLNAGTWPMLARSQFSTLTQQPLAAQNCSFKLLPMVASGGPNKVLEVDWIHFSGVPLDDLFSNP